MSPSYFPFLSGRGARRKKRFDVYATFDRIRPRPALWIGHHSLVRLRAFLDGCFYITAQEYAGLIAAARVKPAEE